MASERALGEAQCCVHIFKLQNSNAAGWQWVPGRQCRATSPTKEGTAFLDACVAGSAASNRPVQINGRDTHSTPSLEAFESNNTPGTSPGTQVEPVSVAFCRCRSGGQHSVSDVKNTPPALLRKITSTIGAVWIPCLLIFADAT